MMMQPYMVLPVDLKVTEQGLFNLLGLKTPLGRHLPGREIFGQESSKNEGIPRFFQVEWHRWYKNLKTIL